MELVTFIGGTYRSLSDDTIITSSSDKRECCASAQQARFIWRKQCIVYKFDEKSYCEHLSIAKVRLKNIFSALHVRGNKKEKFNVFFAFCDCCVCGSFL